MKKSLTRYTHLLTDGWLVGVIALVVLATVGFPTTWANAQSASQGAFTSPLAPPSDADHEAIRALMEKLDTIVDRDALLAEILGITEEELATAREAGTRLDELVESLGLDPATVRTELHEAIDAAIEQAVTDGLLTEEEAELLQNPPAPPSGGPGGPGGGPNGGGPGHHHAPPNTDDETTEDDTTTDSATATSVTGAANRPQREGRGHR